MSLKKLFGQSKNNLKVSSFVGFKKYLEDDVESVGYIEEFIKDRNRFRPHVDYLTASNFAVYGSLEEYYESSIERIQEQYPYDGSLREKIKYFNDSSGFDSFMFENLYPRTNGYITLSANRAGGNGWGNVTSTSGSYGNPESKEYVYVKGGPNIGNVYNTASHQDSNLEIDGIYGNTIEFWLKKSEYVSSKTSREVILDIHTTGVLGDSHKYGRLTVEMDSTDSAATPFLLTYQSGSRGFNTLRVGSDALYSSGSDGVWHHYAFTLQNYSGSIKVSTYVDGLRDKVQITGSSIGSLNTPLVASVGSLVANKVDKGEIVSTYPGLGYGKLSGSLDEFRYWKVARNSRQIGRFWMTSIGAGSNTDPANSALGIYYKFNEGITGAQSIDKKVLDYSGRLSNGTWVGYDGIGRSTNSAIVESGASFREFKDPILYNNHPDVIAFTQNKKEDGYAYDLENNSGLYYSIPNWIVDEDGDRGELKKIVQIIASYFDSLRLQIRELTEINKIKLKSFENKPYPFNKVKLESMGLVTPDIFLDTDNVNIFFNRNEDDHFEKNLSDIKNYIYNNIHNNLQAIYKSKGTEKSFRNLFRCFGIDNELVKIKLYSTDTEYPIETSYSPTSKKIKYVNFNNESNRNASVYQTIEGLPSDIRESDCRGYVTGSEGLLDPTESANIGFTTEAHVFFPTRYEITHPFYYSTPLSSSLFGCYSVKKNSNGQSGADVGWRSSADDDGNFQVFAVKDKLNSKRAKFVLKSRNGLFDPIETQYYKDLYSGERWHLSVKMFSDFEEANNLSGSAASIKIGLHGITPVGHDVADSFFVTRSINASNAQNFVNASKRFYIGANRQDFTGIKLNDTDVKITNFRHWKTALSNKELQSHAVDVSSYGVDTPSRRMFSLVDVGNVQVPKIDLLAIDWNFYNLTGSNTDGEMHILDASSGSVGNKHGAISQIAGRIHPGKGIFFKSSTTSSLDVEFESTSKLEEFESVRSTDMVRILNFDDETFTRETRPTNYYFSFEKSMYDVISDEMLSYFAGISEFSNLIGAPVERYRQNYKGLEKLRQIFFSKIKNEPDIERFMEYYKWLDSSLSIMIDQLVPASVDASDDIRNVIQSHILERSKYFHKLPTMEFKAVEPEGQLRGINELLYDWEHGHAPFGNPNDNCLWTRERAHRREDLYVTSSVEGVDLDRETIRRVSVTDVSGSTYARRRLSRPYRLEVEDQRHAKGGDNTFGNKKKRFYTGVSTAHGLSHISVTGSEASSQPCNDIINPSKKRKVHAAADIAFTHKDRDINDIAPFTIYSSSIDAPTDYSAYLYDNFKQGVQITNLHSDEYGDDREITLQSPFTERWVGGNAHRHQDVVQEQAVKATATIQISDASTENIGHDSRITITSIQGLTKTYTFKQDVGYTKEFTLTAGGQVLLPAAEWSGSAVIDLAAAINGSTGHNGQIAASVDGTTLTLKQALYGPEGNLPITYNFTNPGAQCTVSVNSAPVNGETFTITDESSTTQTFVVDTSVTTQDGTRDGSNRVIIGTNGLSTVQEYGEAIVNAINGARQKGYLSEIFAARKATAGPWEMLFVHSNTGTVTNFAVVESVSWITAGTEQGRTLPATLTIGNFEGGKNGFSSRVEAFKLLAQQGKLYVLPPNASGLDNSNLPIIDHNIQTAQMLREDLAKRPVNIRNIHSTTSSLSLGNFNHMYDVVQYTSEDQRRDLLVDNIEQMTSSNSTAIPGVKEFSKFYRPSRKTVFKARFAAPGGTEVAGDSRGGHSIDRETNQYSVYNSLNYRNLSVRGPLDYLSKIPQTGSKESNSLVTNHRINNNPRYRYKLDGGMYNGEVDVNQDNAFVTHPIPQNDYQYSWITASLVTGRSPVEIAGHLHSFTQAAVGDNTGSLRYERTYQFLTASNRQGKNIIDFAGLNTYIVDTLNTSGSVVDTLAPQNYLLSKGYILNYNLTGVIHHRQGPYGWPSWKQVRAGQTQLGRYLSKNNIYAPPITTLFNAAAGFEFANLKLNSGGDYSWPDKLLATGVRTNDRTVQNTKYRFVDPPVTSNRYPMEIYGAVTQRRIPGLLGATIPTVYREKRTFGNKFVNFANKNLSAILRNIKKVDVLKQGLTERQGIDEPSIIEAYEDALNAEPNSSINYSFDVFPKEKFGYLKNTRGRNRFSADSFWKSKQSDRVKTNQLNSQGNTIPKLSVWPLDSTENFKTTEINTTTDILGSSGQGELFADYAVFHNGKSHPSASAIYARPFPMQSKTSLPNLDVYEFTNTISWSNFMNPPTDRVVDYFTNWYLYDVFAPNTRVKETNTQDTTGSVNPGEVPVGFENNLGETSDNGASVSGPQVFNNGYNPGDPPSQFRAAFIGLVGNATNMSTGSSTFETELPGSNTYEYYRYLQTTGSILGDKPMLIEFHLKTGGNPSSADNFGLNQADKPFYVQIRGNSDNEYKTIWKTETISDYTSTDRWKKVSILVTSSFGEDQQVRFIAPTDASAEDDWGMMFVNIFTGSLFQRQVYYNGDAQAFIDKMTVSASGEFPTERRKVSTISNADSQILVNPSNEYSHISFRDMNNFMDHNSEYLVNRKWGQSFQLNALHDDEHNYNRILKAKPSNRFARVYAKNEKIDHYLLGSQFYRIPEDSGRSPFNFENYESWLHQSRLLVKDFSVIPEFRMSNHMDYYISRVGGSDPFYTCNKEFLTLTGAVDYASSDDEEFYETYAHSDFINMFSVVENTLKEESDASPTRLTLQCKAYKKFLPYKGFYPADRMVQLANEFSSSYSSHVSGGHWRNALAPYYAPGIGFNSIKSGIAVDYPVIEPNPDRTYNKFGVMFQSASLACDFDGGVSTATIDVSNHHTPLVSGHGRAQAGLEVRNNANITLGDTITFNATDGTEIVLTAATVTTTTDTNSPTFAIGASGTDTATNIKTALNANSKLIASVYNADVTIVQSKAGSAGNGGIVLNLTDDECIDSTNFSGGVGADCFPELSKNRIEIGGGSEWAKALTGSLSGGGNLFAASFWMYLPTGIASNTTFFASDTGHSYGHMQQNGLLFSFGGKKDGTVEAFQTGLHIGYYNNYDANWEIDHDYGDKDPSIQFFVMGGNGDDWYFHTTYDSEDRLRHGWNHIYLHMSLNDSQPNQFKVYANNQQYTSVQNLEKSATISSLVNEKIISLEGHRNCFIGNNLEETKRKNANILENLNQSTYITGSDLNDRYTLTNLLKPSELILSDVCIFNKYLSTEEIQRISGWKTAPVLNTETGNSSGYVGANRTVGEFAGAVSPYVALNAKNHGKIVAWYRIGNDTGWTSKTNHNSNGLVVYNHARNLMSGEIISQNSGTLDHYSGKYNNTVPLNFLSGNLYGFTEWTGSVTSDLAWNNNLRQRWNGVVDVSNPAQYTLCYHRPNPYQFKTWFNFNENFTPWFDFNTNNAEHFVEKDAFEDPIHSRNLNDTLTLVTGAVKVPTFIVGNKLNFTDDSSIPRIGSASYGTYHYLANGNKQDDPVYSLGWNSETDTGVAGTTRIPFEAIIRPALFTPPMKNDGDTNVAMFYEVEPHPSASLLGWFNQKRKYRGQNSHGQQSIEWTDDAFDNSYKTDRNFVFGVAKDSQAMMSEFNLSDASVGSKIYDYAANNFYAEVMNFFLDNKQGVTIRSADSLQSPIDYNKTYNMSIILDRGKERGLDNPMYNNPAAFGIPFDAGVQRPTDPDGNYLNRTDELRGYGFSPYLPPHYDGFARAYYTFTPDNNRTYNSITDVMEDTTIEFQRIVSSTGSVSATGYLKKDSTEVPASYNRKFAMHLSASFTGLNKDSQLSYVDTLSKDGDPIEGRRSIVIQSKFECPNFDFSKSTADQPRTDRDSQILPKIKGMWHQTGSSEGSRASIRIVRPNPKLSGDLASLLGMTLETDSRIGQVADRKTIKEAVVAIPFKRVNGVRKFFDLPPDEVYQAVRELGYPTYKLIEEEDKQRYNQFKEFINDTEGEKLRFPRRSVLDMVKSMLQYNIPPQFNFLKYNDKNGKYIKPFAMYLFEFSMELTKQDLENIWQNATPDIGLDYYGRENDNLVIENSTVTHELFTPNDILSDIQGIDVQSIIGLNAVSTTNTITGYEDGITKDLQWMVFKVKQKGEASYFRKKELDRLPNGHGNKVISVEDDIYRYGFNWPYDYFSIVELVNIKATTQFKAAPPIMQVNQESANMLRFRKENK